MYFLFIHIWSRLDIISCSGLDPTLYVRCTPGSPSTSVTKETNLKATAVGARPNALEKERGTLS
jgi:hypothetical protein